MTQVSCYNGVCEDNITRRKPCAITNILHWKSVKSYSIFLRKDIPSLKLRKNWDGTSPPYLANSGGTVAEDSISRPPRSRCIPSEERLAARANALTIQSFSKQSRKSSWSTSGRPSRLPDDWRWNGSGLSSAMQQFTVPSTAVRSTPAPVPMAAGASSESCGTAAKHAIPSRTKSGAGRSGSAMTSASAPPEPPIVPVAGIGKATPWQVS